MVLRLLHAFPIGPWWSRCPRADTPLVDWFLAFWSSKEESYPTAKRDRLTYLPFNGHERKGKKDLGRGWDNTVQLPNPNAETMWCCTQTGAPFPRVLGTNVGKNATAIRCCAVTEELSEPGVLITDK